MGQRLEAFRQAAAAIEPGDRSLHGPTLWRHLEACGDIGALDDLDIDLGEKTDLNRPVTEQEAELAPSKRGA